jgi:DNA-binding NarL/FixJ family response regulator
MGRKVIVAEDDPVLGSVIHATLEAVGHDVVAVVPTAEEAVALALNAKPDVVVMDVSLAGRMNGIEAASRLRRRSACRVVFHTASADRDHLDRMLAMRDTSVVRKPGHIARLVEAVSSSDKDGAAEGARAGGSPNVTERRAGGRKASPRRW